MSTPMVDLGSCSADLAEALAALLEKVEPTAAGAR